MDQRCIRVSIVCKGLGRILRGYEQSTSETFAALRGCEGLDVELSEPPVLIVLAVA